MSDPKIEVVIDEKLTGDVKQNALDFVAYMDENEMPPIWSDGIWVCRYQDKPVCVVFINGEEQMPGPWTIWHSGYDPQYAADEIPAGEDGDVIGLNDLSVDDSLKEAAWAHINVCGSCGCGRQPGRCTTVFGKEFDHVCTSTLAFTNPDAATVAHIKKLANLMKSGISNNL